jgi:hypothetical protein
MAGRTFSSKRTYGCEEKIRVQISKLKQQAFFSVSFVLGSNLFGTSHDAMCLIKEYFHETRQI